MALEDRDTETSAEDWEGWVELHDMAVALTEGGVMSRSRHTFEVKNLTNDDLQFQMEYKHYLQKWDGHNWVAVGDDTRPNVRWGQNGNFTCLEPEGTTYGHAEIQRDKHWSNTRSVIDSDGQAGDRYKLSCYTLVAPVRPVDGDSIKAQVNEREFTVLNRGHYGSLTVPGCLSRSSGHGTNEASAALSRHLGGIGAPVLLRGFPVPGDAIGYVEACAGLQWGGPITL